MVVKLKDIASIQMGYSFRSRLETSEDGCVAVIQMKDLEDDNTVNCNDLIRINMDSIKDHHIAKKGDLVFRSRGLVTKTAVLLEDPGAAVISAPLLRIRVNDTSKVLSEYLNWFISQRDAQVFLGSRAKGTVQKMISKQTLNDLEVVLPSLGHQKRIVELAKLAEKEVELLHSLADKREQYVGAVLMKFTKGEGK